MKTKHIAIAVAAATAFVSCKMEQSFEELTPLKEGSIAFVIKNTATKSDVASTASSTGITIPVGDDNFGNSYFFEETVEELNPTPSTKGSPIYTSNVGTLYTELSVYATGTVNGEAILKVIDEYQHDKNNASLGNGWRFTHSYPGNNPWPDDATPVDFYLNIPASPDGLSNLKRENKQFEFSYSSPFTGAEQEDIIFGHTSLTKTQHDGYLPNGAPVTMYHALSGVKFRVGNDNVGETKTIITKVELFNLYDGGKCVINPASGEVSWPAENLTMTLGSFSQEFDNPTYNPDLEDRTQNPDGTVSTWNDDLNGTSWTAAASDHNLNDKDGSLTFWFIPQAINTDVQLKVTFVVKTKNTPNGEKITHTINFGEQLAEKRVEWKAGQLRTYTLEPKDVNVDIFDGMEDYTKSNLEVTNTGNVDEYVRIMLMGNWYGWLPDQNPATDEPSIIVGYKTADMNDEEMVDNWFFRSVPFGNGFDDTFKMGVPANGNKWIRGTGSYYYYPDIIGAGDKLSTSSALFRSYTLDPAWVPEIWIPVGGVRKKAKGVHLVFECAVQAIGTKKPDGTPYASCWEAWSAATGETIVPK